MGRHSAQHVVREPRHMGLLDIAKRLRGQKDDIRVFVIRSDYGVVSMHLRGEAGHNWGFNGEIGLDLDSAESSQIGGDAVVEQMAEALFDKMHARLNKETKANG